MCRMYCGVKFVVQMSESGTLSCTLRTSEYNDATGFGLNEVAELLELRSSDVGAFEFVLSARR